MRSILIMTKFDVERDPRPKRIADCLGKDFKITLFGAGNIKSNRITFVPFGGRKKRSLTEKLFNLLNNLVGRYERVVSNMNYPSIEVLLEQNEYDLIFCHDLDFLPSVVKKKRKAKLILDAREYYPAQYEEQFIWRLLRGRLNHYLCRIYLNSCDKVITVSESIALKYSQQFDVVVDEIQSWPPYYDLSPMKVDEQNIKIIHHGGANSNRKIENMIKVMDYVDSRFRMDLMLLYENNQYYEYLVAEANKRPNVRIIEPVKHEDIIPVTNQYDIGIFLCPPSTLNLKYALPNKLFEYIQSRLLVAIGPSIEMVKIVKEYQVGLISKDFSPEAMANELCKLNKDTIYECKRNANKAAKKLNAEENCLNIRKMIKEILAV